MSIEIGGFCDEQFEPLKQAFAANFDAGFEVGASVAVTHQGRSVVDLWAGYADVEKSRPWQEDTIVNVFSTTKVMNIICILKLVSEGRIDLDVPVATYWPEFGQAGKSKVTTRQVLIHRAGLPGFSEPQTFEALHDWNYIVDVLARQEPWWEPGTQTCYHMITYGFILGELTRRVTGSLLSEYFENEFSRPAGADFHIGLKDREILNRVAGLKFPEVPMSFEGIGERVMSSILDGDWESWEHQSAEVPAGNGYGNARSIARIGAILAMNGELDGRRYLSPETVEMAATEQSYSECPMIGMVRFGLGFGLHSDGFSAPTPSSFHWGGYGGSSVVMDTPTGLSFAYAPNNMVVTDEVGDDPRIKRLWDALTSVMAQL